MPQTWKDECKLIDEIARANGMRFRGDPGRSEGIVPASQRSNRPRQYFDAQCLAKPIERLHALFGYLDHPRTLWDGRRPGAIVGQPYRAAVRPLVEARRYLQYFELSLLLPVVQTASPFVMCRLDPELRRRALCCVVLPTVRVAEWQWASWQLSEQGAIAASVQHLVGGSSH